MPHDLPVLTVTEVGEYIRHHSCERRFKLAFNKRSEAKRLPFAERLFNVMDPVLQREGRARERQWEQSLAESGYTDVAPAADRAPDVNASWDTFRAGVAALAPGESAYGREVTVTASLGAFQVEGRIDFCVIRWDGLRPRLRLVECKASRRDRTYQRIQVTIYLMMVKRLLQAGGLVVGGVELGPDDVDCVVARIDENTNEGQSILDLAPLDVSQEEADIRRLLGPEGALIRIARTPLDELDYQLNAKCDNCVFNVDCFPESARFRRIQLLGVEPSIVRALRSVGIDTLDDLANLDLEGPQAHAVRALPGFNQSLAALRTLAGARRSTLPRGEEDPDDFKVQGLPNFPSSQLPLHEVAGRRLIRVYLTVHYDYVENRIGAVAAHVTTSAGQLHTRFIQVDGRWQPEAGIQERREVGRDPDNKPIYELDPIAGTELTRPKAGPWTGRYDEDTASERELLSGFFDDLVQAIADAANGAAEAPVHFYVWTRSEMAQLVEACSRAGAGLLSHLRELLGCREPLEQLIYSCLEDETRNRFALGWTGRGLAVVSSLQWFGTTYHWRRRVAGVDVDLDHVFTQDIFDFKTELWQQPDGAWAEARTPGATPHKFEIRSRFHDTLTAPYWRALWESSPDPDTLPPQESKVANAIRRYNMAREPGRFRAYLIARAHALRWVEERIRFKNEEIEKPPISIRELMQFRLGVDTTSRAAIDFLRLDHHVSVTDWLAGRLVPPAYRVSAGRMVPISNVRSLGRGALEAQIDLTGYDMSPEALQSHCSIGEGSWVRLTPCSETPSQGQTIRQLLRAGSTCKVEELDWETGAVRLTVMPPTNADQYRLGSYSYRDPGPAFDHATLDESPSDYVKGRVESRLRARETHHACDWLNPIRPEVPAQAAPSAADMARYAEVLTRLRLPNGKPLEPDQRNAALAGLESRIQLLQGPPGTGKTTTTAVATLLRILARRRVGEVVLLSANTHRAVNTLLDAITRILPGFIQAAREAGLIMPPVRMREGHLLRRL